MDHFLTNFQIPRSPNFQISKSSEYYFPCNMVTWVETPMLDTRLFVTLTPVISVILQNPTTGNLLERHSLTIHILQQNSLVLIKL